MKRKKKNYKIFIGIIIGIILSSVTVYAATVLAASDVSYSNSTSRLSSTNVQGAIDEIYNNVKGTNITYHNGNIVGAYMYDANKCPTGNEATCIKTNCPNDTSDNSCPSGTIIKYKVNGSTTKTFNVLHDDISTMTMQQNENTTEHVAWYSVSYASNYGPLTAIVALESATSGWSNVNTIEYTMGTTSFGKDKNAYTGCGCDNSGCSCTTNTYTLGARSGKARMITLQEASMMGCTSASYSCPRWMKMGSRYWTMSADSSYSGRTFYLHTLIGSVNSNLDPTHTDYGARAVVVISK